MSSKPPSNLVRSKMRPEHSFADNLIYLHASFPQFPRGLSWKLSKGQRITSIESQDPVETATQFAALASTGAVSEKKLLNGYVRKMADGSFVTLRIASSSDGTPAVSLKITSEEHIMKIHFTLKGNDHAGR